MAFVQTVFKVGAMAPCAILVYGVMLPSSVLWRESTRESFLDGGGQPVLAKSPLSQPVHTRTNTKQPPATPPMQAPSQLDWESSEFGGGSSMTGQAPVSF